MLLWLPVGFLLGWFIAAQLLMRRAAEFAAMSLFGQVNEWREVLASSVDSGEPSKTEKIKLVLEGMGEFLGG